MESQVEKLGSSGAVLIGNPKVRTEGSVRDRDRDLVFADYDLLGTRVRHSFKLPSDRRSKKTAERSCHADVVSI